MEFDYNSGVQMLLRWIHYWAGITWIGLLYFFNFVNANFAKTLDADTKKKVMPELMPRALFWFRWGAMITWLSGFAYIIWKNWVVTDAGFMGEGGLISSAWGKWISLGILFGTIMWFNVWFVIWPNQRKIIRAIKGGEAPDAKLVAQATFRSKMNTWLSIPLLFSMGAATHFPYARWYWMLIVTVVGFAAAHHLILAGTKVKTDV